MAGFMFDPELINAPVALMMSDRQFRRKFLAAARGDLNELSPFVKPWNCRPPANEWKVIRERIFARDDYTCQYCGVRGVRLQCDHVVPVAKGGRHDDCNLKTACESCNRSKRDKTIEEWSPHV